MFLFLLALHSVWRWLVLFSLIYVIVRSWSRSKQNLPFTKFDNSIRHWTATISHIQLAMGAILYLKSPTVQYFFQNTSEALSSSDAVFFGVVHILLMILSVVFITIGSALAKRKKEANLKYRILLRWFGLGLFLIFIAIPWPFSPIAARELIRPF